MSVIIRCHDATASNALQSLGHMLWTRGKEVNTGHWQALKNVPHTKTIELTNVQVSFENMPSTVEGLQLYFEPNLPWSEDHFQERVSGEPLNPGEQYKNWPWFNPNWEAQSMKPPLISEKAWAYIAGFIDGEASIDISKGYPRIHIYQKDPTILQWIQQTLQIGRLSSRRQTSQLKTNTMISILCITNRAETQWVLPHLIPHLRVKHASAIEAWNLVKDWTKSNYVSKELPLSPRFSHSYMQRFWPKGLGSGIEFRYGDLNDLVELLAREPYTRQAYLPVWFPEDTGAHHRERVPCTLGYHFMLREGKLNIFYPIRSCDFLRYMRDDCYLAARLGLWIVERLRERKIVATADEGTQHYLWDAVQLGHLNFFASSLHIFEGDLPKMRREYG